MKKKKKKKNIGRTLTIIGVVLLVIIVVILVINHIMGDRSPVRLIQNNLNIEQPAAEDGFVYGDPDSDSFDFTGDYFDTATNNATMTISRDGRAYVISLTYSEGSDSLCVWNMIGAYDKNSKAIIYRECVRTDYTIEETTAEGETSTTEATATEETSSGVTSSDKKEVYSDGTGKIYLKDGNLLWADDKEDMGSGLMFMPVEEGEAAETEETE